MIDGKVKHRTTIHTMTTELTLLCHAATHAMKAGTFPSGDDPIDAAACAHLAARFGGTQRHVVTSPARAARETAACFDASPAIDRSFDDLDYGHWRGRAIRDVHDEDPQGLAAWLSEPASAPHGGESLEALAARVMAGLDRYTHGGPYVIVTHAILVKVALARVLNAPLASVYAMDFEPLSSLVLTRGETIWRLRVNAG
jgi:broad specificity phosphatase PhoE